MSPCLSYSTGRRELLERSAADEALRTSLFQHVFNVALSGGYAAVMWALFHDVAGVIENGGGAVLLAETQTLTAPRGAVRGLARYRRGEIGGGGARRRRCVVDDRAARRRVRGGGRGDVLSG